MTRRLESHTAVARQAGDASQAANDVRPGALNNRLNVVMKQLAAPSGIFPPIRLVPGLRAHFRRQHRL